MTWIILIVTGIVQSTQEPVHTWDPFLMTLVVFTILTLVWEVGLVFDVPGK